jgi:hypothetical protein
LEAIYEKTGALKLEQVLICEKEKTAGFHALSIRPAIENLGENLC